MSASISYLTSEIIYRDDCFNTRMFCVAALISSLILNLFWYCTCL